MFNVIMGMIKQLPQKQRIVIELIVEGNSYNEISEMLSIPVQTAWTRRFYGARTVTNRLKEERV